MDPRLTATRPLIGPRIVVTPSVSLTLRPICIAYRQEETSDGR